MDRDAGAPKEKPTQAIQQFLSAEFPDFIVQQRQERSRTLHITLTRVDDGLRHRIIVAPHFLDHHFWPLEIETFLEHHGLVEKVREAGTRSIIIDNIGVHFGKPTDHA
jgi:hypothetical protein